MMNDKLLLINQRGEVQLMDPKLRLHFDDDLVLIEKHEPEKPISAIYFDGIKDEFCIKRFLAERHDNKYSMISSHKNSYLEIISTDWIPVVEVICVKEKGKNRKVITLNISEFISVKGAKARGNRLTKEKVKQINLLDPVEYHRHDQAEGDIEESDVDDLTNNISNEGSQQISLEL